MADDDAPNITAAHDETALRTARERERVLNQRLAALHDVSLTLAQTESLDELCRQAIALGRACLGFDRLGLWFPDGQPGNARGSFGTDETGYLRDERHCRVVIEAGSALEQVLSGARTVVVEPDAALRDPAGAVVGRGMQAIAAMSDGRAVVGALTVDTLLTRQPMDDQQIEVLRLYAATLGHLCTRKRSELALAASERRYRGLVESQQDLIIRLDGAGRLTFTNDAFCTLFCQSRCERLGQSFVRLVHPDDRPDTQAAFDAVRVPPYRAQCEHRALTATGWRRLSWEPYAIRDEQGVIVEVQAVGRDITELRQAEQEARGHMNEVAHLERLNTMGELATHLAHELNQPLAAIANYLGSAIRRFKGPATDPAELLVDLRLAAEQTQRAGAFVRQLKKFIRKHEPVREHVDLHTAVRRAVSLVEDLARSHRVALAYTPDPTLPAVLADDVQIQQVVLNLVRNAVEALAETPPLEAARVTVLAARDGPARVRVTVQDNGPGLPVGAAERVFEAFYTTKPRGTGLGLSISRSIVTAHGGELTALTAPDGGAVFAFTLPICGESADAQS
jgi:PAS domain S-box-containing protein